MLPSSLLGIPATDGHIAFSIWYTHSEPVEWIDRRGRLDSRQRRENEQTCIRLNSEPEHSKNLFVRAVNEMGYPDRIFVFGNFYHAGYYTEIAKIKPKAGA